MNKEHKHPPITYLVTILGVMHDEDLIRIKRRLEKKGHSEIAHFLALELEARDYKSKKDTHQ